MNSTKMEETVSVKGGYPLVYVVVVTYNGMKWVDKCLSSLRTSLLPVTTIVIDNNSTDGTPDYVLKQFPEVHLVRSDKNLGFGKANNIGLKKALVDGADYVFLLNQDAWIEAKTIHYLIQASTRNLDFGILSPLHLNYKGDEIEFYFSTIISPSQCPGLINDFYQSQYKQEIYSIDFIHAACWLITKKCLQHVGGFDPIFFHYSEDIDFVNRCKYWGFKVGIVPTSVFFHFGSHEGLSPKRNKAFEINYCLILLKDIRYKFLGRFLVFLKNYFDKMTSSLIYRKWDNLFIDISVLFDVIGKVTAVRQSRALSSKKSAFL